MQVGSYATDRASWGRPEDISAGRPYYANLAGSSDLAGSVVAGLAAASCALNKTDATAAAAYLAAAAVSCTAWGAEWAGGNCGCYWGGVWNEVGCGC